MSKCHGLTFPSDQIQLMVRWILYGVYIDEKINEECVKIINNKFEIDNETNSNNEFKSEVIQTIKTQIGYVSFKKFEYMMLIQNLNKNFLNGDIVKVYKNEHYCIIFNINLDKIEFYNFGLLNKYPLIPLNYLTIHKSQGLSLNKVLIVLDDIFEITMLYTAITRAKTMVKFVCLNKVSLKKLKLYINAFNHLKKLLYE